MNEPTKEDLERWNEFRRNIEAEIRARRPANQREAPLTDDEKREINQQMLEFFDWNMSS
jgi:hypothetical protein